MAGNETMFGYLKDNQVYLYFLDRKLWDTLSSNERIEMANELERREALKVGRKARVIRAEVMKGGLMGGYHPIDDDIALNDNYFNDALKDTVWSPMCLMDTIIHEGRHAYQRDKMDELKAKAAQGGVFNGGDEEAARWLIDNVCYMSTRTGYNFEAYQSQPIEIDARNYAGHRIADICKQLYAEGLLDFNDVGFLRSWSYLVNNRISDFNRTRVFFRDRSVARMYTAHIQARWKNNSGKIHPRLREYCEGLLKNSFEHINEMLDDRKFDEYMDGLLGIMDAPNAKVHGI